MHTSPAPTAANPADLWPDAEPSDALPPEPDLIDALDMYTPGESIVKATGWNGSVFAGIVVAIDYDNGLIDVRIYDRIAKKWNVSAFHYLKVAPMLTSLSKAQRSEIAGILLTAGKLPDMWQALDALAETQTAPAVAEAV